MHITRKQVAKYALLPGLGGRFKNLIGNGFANLAYFMALVFSTVGILPRNHPLVQPAANGTFGLIKILREGHAHLVFDKKHIDQVIVYFALLIGFVLLALQFIVLCLSVLTSPAFAQNVAGLGGYGSFFIAPYPNTDTALRMLGLVFGVDMFGAANNPNEPIHIALHTLLEFYSLGILVVGCFIILYFGTTIVAETAQTGVPFGKRFNHAWAPVRLILFFALIIPLTNGLNGAQWITLGVAKYGSALASNGWLRFNMLTTGNYLGLTDQLVVTPNTPETMHIPAFIMTARTCYWAQARKFDREIEAYLIHGQGDQGSTPINGLGYQQAVTLAAPDGGGPGGNLIIRFGEKDPDIYDEFDGAVSPYCGEMTLQTTDVSEPGSAIIQEGYFDLIKLLWGGAFNIDQYARNYAFRYLMVPPREPDAPLPDVEFRLLLNAEMDNIVRQAILDGVAAQTDPAIWVEDPELLTRGWVAAAALYNEIASINGAMQAAASNTPTPVLYPDVLEKIRTEKLKNCRNVTPDQQFSRMMCNGEPIIFEDSDDEDVAQALTEVIGFFTRNNLRSDENATRAQDTGSPFVNAINAILGTNGLFDMCRNTDVHPLAQLSAVGKGLIDSAIRNLAVSGGVGLLGGVAGLMGGGDLGAAAMSMAGFFGMVATTGLMIGFILFYVLPFMPFIYFFFGVASWVKSIFEAIVGVPLWALAHLRIDAEGIPGQAATNGYMLLLEIFLRPIFILFGLLASVIILSAQVKALNEIFTLVVSNLNGYSQEITGVTGCVTGTLSGLTEAELGAMTGAQQFMRGPIDEFFFTAMYAIIVYMMANISFKLIDTLPNQMLRWFGSGASSFADDNSGVKSAGEFSKYASVGGTAIGSQLKDGIMSIPEAFGKAGAEANRRKANEGRIVNEIFDTHNRNTSQQINQLQRLDDAFNRDIEGSAANRFERAEEDFREARTTAEQQSARQRAEEALRDMEQARVNGRAQIDSLRSSTDSIFRKQQTMIDADLPISEANVRAFDRQKQAFHERTQIQQRTDQAYQDYQQRLNAM